MFSGEEFSEKKHFQGTIVNMMSIVMMMMMMMMIMVFTILIITIINPFIVGYLGYNSPSTINDDDYDADGHTCDNLFFFQTWMEYDMFHIAQFR